MAVHLNALYDVDHFTEDELLLCERPLEEVLLHAVATLVVDEEEERAVESTRPTMAVFLGEPWR